MANDKNCDEKKDHIEAICRCSLKTVKKHKKAICKCSSRTIKEHKEVMCKVSSRRNEKQLKMSSENEWTRNVDSWHSWLTCLVSFYAGFVCFGIHCNFGLLHRVLVLRHGVHSATTAWLGSLAFGATFFFSPFSNALCETIPISYVSLIGTLLCIFGLLLSSFATNITTLYITYSLCFGTGASLAYFPTVIALKKYFRRHLTLANGLSASGSGLGTLSLGPFIEYCLENIGLRWTYRMLTLLVVTMLVTQFVFMYIERRLQKGFRGQSDAGVKLTFTENIRELILQKDLWKDQRYRIMVISIAVFLFGYFVPYVHLVFLATTRGVPTIKATLLISYLSISSTAGKILFGFLINFSGIRVRTITAISMLCIGLSNCFVPIGTGYISLCLYAIIFGLCEGCITGQIAVIVLETVGCKRMSQGLANLLAINAVFMMSGPPLAGLIYDQTKSYDIAFYISGGTSCIGALVMFILTISDKHNFPLSLGKEEGLEDKDDSVKLAPDSEDSNLSCPTDEEFFMLKETNI